MHCQTNSVSTIRAQLPPSLASPRKQPLDTTDELCCRDLENFREFKDRRQRGTVQTAFQQAYVFRVISTLEGEYFLCELPLLAELTKRSCERSLFWRWVFFSRGHSLS